MSNLSPYVVIGGSFDPIHQGHLWMAWHVFHQLSHAQIVFLPTARSPFKNTQTSAKHRLSMLKLALRDTPFSIDRSEIFQTPPAYTIETLITIRQKIGASRPLIFVMGQDSLESLDRWKNGNELTRWAHLWVFPRTPSTDNLKKNENITATYTKKIQDLQHTAHGCILLDSHTPPNVSSTKIRQHLATSRDLVPKRVWAYNRRTLLYGLSSSYES